MATTVDRTPLLLAKVQRADWVAWPAGTPGLMDADDYILAWVDAGLATIVATDHSSTPGGMVELTPAGVGLAATAGPDLLCSATAGADRAQAALWWWLLLHGRTNGPYGSHQPWGKQGEIAHLLACGVDLAASGPVRDDTWTEWQGTFSDDLHVSGVSGRATCTCGTVTRLQVTAEVESVTALILAVLDIQP